MLILADIGRAGAISFDLSAACRQINKRDIGLIGMARRKLQAIRLATCRSNDGAYGLFWRSPMRLPANEVERSLAGTLG